MKLSIERETLLQPLQTVIGVVERRQTLPILANVLLVAKDDHLAVTATDMEIELIANQRIQSSLEASVQLTVSGRKLLDIFRTFSEDVTIDLQQDKERLMVRSGQSRFVLATLPVASFPKFEAMPPVLTVSLTQRELSALLQSCHFSMAQQDVRYYLNGMLFDMKSDEIRTAATDGHRFAMSHRSVRVMGDRAQVILPRKAVLELMRLLKQDDSKLDMEIGENYLRVKNECFTFTSRLIDGRFPEYERILPKEAGHAISLNKNALKNALLRVAILSNEKCRVVHLKLRAGFLHILANNPEQEEAEEILSVEYTGKELDIAFNVAYLLDALNAVSHEAIRLTFIDANNRMLIEEMGNDQHLFLIMPLQI